MYIDTIESNLIFAMKLWKKKITIPICFFFEDPNNFILWRQMINN